jgi:hypothetical protein
MSSTKKQQNEAIALAKKQLQKEQKRKAEIADLAYQLEHPMEGWTVVMDKKTKAEVEAYIKQKKEDEENEKRFESNWDDDEYDNRDYCRNCGSDDTWFHGCCSAKCANKADEYY